LSAVKNVLKDNYNLMLLKDYLREKIKDAGFSDVEIQKTPTGTKVALHVTRPGIVIGRKGSGIRELTEKLEKDFGLKTPQISVLEIAKPEFSPSVMANRLAGHIRRGTAFRRATMYVLQQIMQGGAMGVEITVSGKLRGDRSAFEKHKHGVLPRAGHHADVVVLEDTAYVETPMGLIGIKVRIAQKEKLVPEFELIESKPKSTKTEKDEAKEAEAKEAEAKEAEAKEAEAKEDEAKEDEAKEAEAKEAEAKEAEAKEAEAKEAEAKEAEAKEAEAKEAEAPITQEGKEAEAPITQEGKEAEKPQTESEQIARDGEKISKLEPYEDDEEKMEK